MEHTSQQHTQQRTSEESVCSRNDSLADIERQKLFFLERMVKEQEKTNTRLNSIIEHQKQAFRNHDRMIDLLYRIAFNK